MLVLVMGVAAMAAPVELAHSGRVLDDLGDPVSGPIALTVTLYDSQGAAGSVWSETFPVTLQQGYYAVELGCAPGNPLELNDFATGELWVGITPGNDAEELARTRVLSVPFAVQAASAQSVDGSTARLTGPLVRQVQRKVVYDLDQTTNGLLASRSFGFTKYYNDTTVLFEWYDNFRCNGSGQVSCRWEVRFRRETEPVGSGRNCADNLPIRADCYDASGINRHVPRTIRGVCRTLTDGTVLTAGAWVAEVHEMTVPDHPHGVPYLGWGNRNNNGTSALITVEEIY